MSDTTEDAYLPDDELGSDQEVLNRAKRRFRRCERWESTARQRWLYDYKFANGDDENNYQWYSDIYNQRDSEQRPTLTINKARQHNLLIINDAKQHKQGIKYRPVGDDATRQAADVYEGIARHIQNISHAQDAHGQAIEFQVDAGLGWTRVVTAYVSDDTFDQEIYIRGVADPLSVYLDPSVTEPDGSDAKFGFVFADKDRDELEAEYPWLGGVAPPANVIDGEDGGWIREDTVREAEYYEVTEESDELIGDEEGTTILKSLVPSDLLKRWEDEALQRGEKLQRRKVKRRKVHWYRIVGDRIVEDAPWAGTTVPIVPWIGQQTIIDDQLDRKGHTRYLKSAQRMLNYNRSAAVEYGALQTKVPWVGPADAIEGYETYWGSANTVNHSYLAYNHKDDQGGEIPPPQRPAPPQSAPVYMEGAQAAENDMMSASGQYQSELGAPGNEVSGKAINERQRMSDRATYHFTDNQAIAIRREGSILLELIPKIYDTKRVIRILGEDGTEGHVQIDPDLSVAHQEAPPPPENENVEPVAQRISAIFNPGIGRYEVVSDVGPDYATQRQEAFNAIVQIITQAPDLLSKIGDLLFKVADFPLADQIAERLKPGLQPEAQQAITQLQVQLQQGNKALGEAMQALAEERLKNRARDGKTNIDAFRADTDRLAVMRDILKDDPAVMMALQPLIAAQVAQAIQQAMQDNLGPVRGTTIENLDLQRQGAPPPGATGHLPLGMPGTGPAPSVTPGLPQEAAQ